MNEYIGVGTIDYEIGVLFRVGGASEKRLAVRRGDKFGYRETKVKHGLDADGTLFFTRDDFGDDFVLREFVNYQRIFDSRG